MLAVTTEKWKTLKRNKKKRKLGGRTCFKIGGSYTISPLNYSDLSKKKH